MRYNDVRFPWGRLLLIAGLVAYWVAMSHQSAEHRTKSAGIVTVESSSRVKGDFSTRAIVETSGGRFVVEQYQPIDPGSVVEIRVNRYGRRSIDLGDGKLLNIIGKDVR